MVATFAGQYFWDLSLNFPEVGCGNEEASVVQGAGPTQ